MFGQPTLTGEYTLDGNGKLAVPLIGNVNAQGQTTGQLQQAIASRLDPDVLRNPSVSRWWYRFVETLGNCGCIAY